jgi:hypothetical protein
MLYAYTYFNALLSLLITFGMARYLDASVFQVIALGLAAGGFGAVLSNMGTDQSQLGRLLDAPTAADRNRLVLHNLARRSLVYLLLLGLMLGYATSSHGNWQLAICSTLYFAWAGLVGLQPNAYADYLHTQRRQQLVNVLERTGACSAIAMLWLSTGETDLLIGLWTGFILLSTRLLATIYQWQVTLHEDRSRQHTAITTPNDGAPRKATQTSLSPTIAALCNSCTAYFPVLFLDYFDQKSDLALYSLVLQAANIVILFQGVASRLLSVRIATAQHQATGPEASRLILRFGSGVLATSTILALIGGSATAAYLIHADRFGSPEKIITLVIILFAWGAWLGFGQVITRALVLHGQARFYAWSAVVTSIISASTAWVLVAPYGAIASALSIALPHSLMIGFCAHHLHRTLSRKAPE